MIATKEQSALMLLEAGAVEIRDIDAGEEPFLYSSGNWGPGYITVKGQVGKKRLIKFLTQHLAVAVAEICPQIEFVGGNATGGMIPGWILSEFLEPLLGRPIPFVYVRDTRKKGGQKERITGAANNPEIRSGANALVVEELVNFAQTTCNSAVALREDGYLVTNAATILFYGNPVAVKSLEEHEIEMVLLLTLPELLEVAEEHQTHSQQAIDDYRVFLTDPLDWQARRGLEPVIEGGTK